MSKYCSLGIANFSIIMLALGAAYGRPDGAIVEYIEAPQQPVHVKEVSISESGDLVISIHNTSDKYIRLIVFGLSGALCPASGKPPALAVGYGDWTVVNSENSGPGEPALLPGSVAWVVMPASTYNWMLADQIKRDCKDTARPQLILKLVAYCDGTGWEGFADGPNHAYWNGRAWTPEGTPLNCGPP